MYLNRSLALASIFLSFAVFCGSQQSRTSPSTDSPKMANATMHDCPECPEMVIIPAGSFRMGSPSAELGRYDEEGPQRVVHVRSFAAAKYTVTRGEWKLFVRATQRGTEKGCDYSLLPEENESSASWINLGFHQDDNHPVVCVSWKDAKDYARWLSEKSGHTYRLLTEAEWEYAARSGTTTPYPWGSSASHEYANYGGDDHPGYGVVSGRDKWLETSPVDSFPPNAFGLYDMHGNVMQWVEDCFSNAYAGLPVDGSAFTVSAPIHVTGEFASLNGTNSCAYRMLRGGDWGDTPGMIRSASRNFAPPEKKSLETYRSSGLGIRVARNLD